MTSKEDLKSICLECEMEKGKNKTACPFRSISNDHCEEYEKIEKDLEALEVLKRSISDKERFQYALNKTGRGKKVLMMALTIKGDDIKQIKEWLENDK